MKNSNLKQLKRALLGILAVAIVGLAAANLSIALNGADFIVNMSLAGPETLAQGEEPGGGVWLSKKCKTEQEQEYINGGIKVTYSCADGSEVNCWEGDVIIYNNGGMEDGREKVFCLSE